MRYAQRKILDCHAFAKEAGCKEDVALCHAVGQACSVVHTAGHAIGYPAYDLTAIIHRYGIDAVSYTHLDQLRQGVSLRAIGHRDPVMEYKFCLLYTSNNRG